MVCWLEMGGIGMGGRLLSVGYLYISNMSLLLGQEPFKKFDVDGWVGGEKAF